MVPCTGRAFASVPELVQTLPCVQYMIVSNGAAIYRVEDGERIYGCTLSVDSVEPDSGASDVGGDDIRSTDSGTVLYGAALH